MLKIQSPEKDIFSSSDLEWKDDIAYIPTNRFHQFLAGEELGCGTTPTKFKIMSSRTRKEGSLQVHRIRPQCWLKYTRYWCTYGPRDHRHTIDRDTARGPDRTESDSGPGSSGANVGRPSSRRGEDFARGCTCHFNAKVMYLWPNITQINYVHRTHTDVSGSICHGLLDPSARGSKAQFAPRLSMDMRRWVFYLLSRNIRTKQILQEHQVLLEDKRSRNQGYTLVRDDFLNKHDILNISKRLSEETFQMHIFEEENIRKWVQNHRQCVFYHQDEDKVANTPFIFGLQTPWQKDKLVTLGHQRVVAFSTTFGKHRFNYQLFTLLVFDMHQNAIPGAWIVTSSYKTCNFKECLLGLNQSMNEHVKGWTPNCFIIDNCGFEIDAIRSVYDAPVYLCLWRIRRRWLKHLNRKVQDVNTRSAMFRNLGEIMDLSSQQSPLSLCSTETLALKRVVCFLENFKEEKNFSLYFQDTWSPQMGPWIKATQNLPHTNLDINSAIEGYHVNLKARLQGRGTVLGTRIDWLLHTLLKDVESHFWFIDFCQKWGFWHSTTKQLVIETSLSQAVAIPDSNVALSYHGGNRAAHGSSISRILDINEADRVYNVYNSDTEWLLCDCAWSQQGNMCKHQMKILIMKGTIGAQDFSTSSLLTSQEGGMTKASVVDYNLPWIAGQRQNTPPSQVSSSELYSEIRGFGDEEIMDEKLNEATEDDSSPGLAMFGESFTALVDSVSDINDVRLANHVSGIVTNAAQKISKLKEFASSDSSRHVSLHHFDFVDSSRHQNSSNDPNCARPMMVEQIFCRKRKGRATEMDGEGLVC